MSAAKRTLPAFLAALCGSLLLAVPVSAATFTVNSQSDGHDSAPGDGTCDAAVKPQAPFCSLRAAVEEADGNKVEGDVINVPKGTYVLTLAAGGQLAIGTKMDIVGAGANQAFITVQKEGALGGDRIFAIGAAGDVRLAGLNISGGAALPKNGTAGGNIQTLGALRIETSQIAGGTADGGGGIANAGALTIVRSTLTDNEALTETGLGGAIYNFGLRSTAGLVSIVNSTISGNRARLGAGVFSTGNSANRVSFASSTLAFNEGGNLGGGGGIHVGAGSADFENSIVAKNSTEASPLANCSAEEGASIVSQGFNVEDSTDCGFGTTGDSQGFDALLRPLASNNGATPTHAIPVASPAIDRGVKACPATDQRGVARPAGASCDAGAYEQSDRTAPDTTIDTGPNGPTASTSATFTFSSTEAGSTFQCSLDGAAFGACPASYTGLAQGSHTFQVRATDSVGNTDASPASRTWTVDTIAPDTTLGAGGPSGTVASTSASFTFSSNEAGATFQCSLDGAAFGACPAGYTGLAQGSHTFQVRARDAAGNTDATPASRTWTVDTIAPDTTLGAGGPSGTVASTSATFTFSSNEAGATFQCSLDGAAFGACPASYTGLAQGSHTFQVRARDAAGNVDSSPASRTWTVDTVAPDTTLGAGGPSGTVASTSATFTFSSNEAGATFQCSLDGAAFGACPASYTGLAQGSHTFQVRARDAAGNVDSSPASRTWTVDTGPPDTSISAGPSGLTNSTSATFAFASTESGSTFECSLDGAAFGACPASYTGLAQGSHTFEVRATDAVGNVDPTPASRSWTVDTTPPSTTIESGPGGPIGGPPASTTEPDATFTFASAEAGLAFECRLDGGAFAPCTSPKAYPGLAPGDHSFELRATDAAGNEGVVGHSWTVVVVSQAKRTTLADLPPPVLGKQTNVEPVSGKVLVALPLRVAQRGLTFVPLSEARQIPVGAFLDTRKGTVRMQTASAAAGKTYLGKFNGGLFKTLQSRGGGTRGLTDLVLSGGRATSCAAKRGKRASAALSRKALRKLSGNAKGRFRTRGRFSAATVRGTKWTVTDRCDGTLTKVTRGKVAVRDFRRRKTILVKAGRTYLAKAPPKR